MNGNIPSVAFSFGFTDPGLFLSYYSVVLLSPFFFFSITEVQ